MKAISDDLLNELSWKDISLIRNEAGEGVLILICKDEKTKTGLYNLMTTSEFELIITIENDKTYTIWVEFKNAKNALIHKTGLTSQQYPSLTWLNTGEVKYITAGTWIQEPSLSNFYRPLLYCVPMMNNN